MFCQNCGAKNPDEACFCENCGTKLEVSAAPSQELTGDEANVQVTPEYQATGVTGTYTKNNTGVIKAIIAIVLVAVIAIVGIFVACSASGSSYEDPIKYAVKAMNSGDYKTMLKAFPKEFEAAIKNEPEAKMMLDESFRMMNVELKEEYGSNAKVKYEILAKKRIDKYDLPDIEEEYNDYIEDVYYYSDIELDYMRVTDAYELEVVLIVEGREGSDVEHETMTVCKVGGRWVAMDMGF